MLAVIWTLFSQQPWDLAVHEFRFVSTARVAKVDVAGTFNNWNTSADPMQLGPDGRTWTLSKKLPFGKIQYKFIVDGSDWELDPSVPKISDGNGHENSVLLVTPPDYASPASPSDGVTAVSALRHRPAIPDLNYDHGKLRFILRARPNDLAAVYLRENGSRVTMSPAGQDDLYETYVAYVPWDRKRDIQYDFELRDGPTVAYYGADGFEKGKDQPFRLVAKSYKPFEVPSWVEKSVVYQIFPDRFADGDRANDPPSVEPWGAKPTYSNRFGGDTAGVLQHLDYLSSLGVGAVYFTPVFKSPSNHRYDTADYLKVDPEFGTNEEFDGLTKAMQANGIRTVMDFAFNHTSPKFWAFQDVMEKGQASVYKDWYFIKSYPVSVRENPPYVAWDNYPSMPKFNVMNPATHDYVLKAVDYWKQHAGISGVRLDVANEVNPQMWRDLRSHLKGYAPDTWIVGEEWGDASPWLGGDQWDSTMGYQFRDACLHFFAEGSKSPTQFTGNLMSVYSSYAPQVARNLMNLLGSHDTPRFLTLCHGDKSLLKLAATVELMWPGAPTIYYGDELGMTGGADPDNRQCMDWGLVGPDNDLLAYYKKVIKIRRTEKAVQSGDPEILMADDAKRSFAFSRTLDDNGCVVVVNASRSRQTLSVPLPAVLSDLAVPELTDLLSIQRLAVQGSRVSVSLEPLTAAVLVPSVIYGGGFTKP